MIYLYRGRNQLLPHGRQGTANLRLVRQERTYRAETVLPFAKVGEQYKVDESACSRRASDELGHSLPHGWRGVFWQGIPTPHAGAHTRVTERAWATIAPIRRPCGCTPHWGTRRVRPQKRHGQHRSQKNGRPPRPVE